MSVCVVVVVVVCMWWYVVACGWMARWGCLAKVLDLGALGSARP